MQRWAEGLGCSFRYDAILHNRLDGDPGPLRYRLPPAEVVRLQFTDARDRAEFREYQARLGPALPAKARLFECGAGLMTLHVDPAGRAHACMMWRTDPYDLLRRPLDAGWHRHLRRLRARPAPAGACRACPDRGLCNCCPPLARLESGQLSQAVAYHCALADERKRQAD